MTKRSVGTVILLSIITCGIYFLFWYVDVTNDIEAELGSESDGSCASGGMALLFAIITCGIYYFYWWFKQAKRMEQVGELRSVRISDNSLVYLILSLFGLSIIGVALLQSDINKVADAR